MNGAAAPFLVIDPGHPALPGHFPGRPIVPGVLLLDAVLQAAGCRRGRLLRVRFTAPVLPGERIEIELGPARAGRTDPALFTFTCRRNGAVVLSGEIECAVEP